MSLDSTSRSHARAWLLPAIAGMAVTFIMVAVFAVNALNDGQASRDEMAVAGVSRLDGLPTRLTSALEGALDRRQIPNRGKPRFFAGDRGFEELDATNYSEAQFMYVDIKSGSHHAWRLYAGKELGADSINPATACPKDEPSTLACTVTSQSDGSVLIDRTLVAVYNAQIKNYVFVDWRHLEPTALPEVRIQRSWNLFRPGGGKTAVVEDVYGPKSVSLDELTTTTDDWVPLLADPSLAIPTE